MTSDARVPPHNLEIEKALLGAMLLRPEAITAALAEGITSADFYRPSNGTLFDAIVRLRARGGPSDPASVGEEMRRLGALDSFTVIDRRGFEVSGSAALLTLEVEAPATSNAGSYAKSIGELALYRRIIGAASEVAEIGYSSPSDAGDAAVAALRRIAEVVNPFTTRLQRASFLDGAAWALDLPDGVPAVWGRDGQVLWAEGEPLLIVGPPGVGKTTIVQQIVVAGLRPDGGEVLGLPVRPALGKTLYLACDRPRQIARAFARCVSPEDRDLLAERLVVWKGPPVRDFGRDPLALVDMCEEVGATRVVIDSLKDVAVGLSEDDVGAGLNRCIQHAIAKGIDVVALHHQRKAQNGSKPKSLEDVYGSTWITAGAGSVVLVWGQAGDAEVELIHLKQPAEVVGPLHIEHDHERGTSSVLRGPIDPFVALTNAPGGLTAADLARMHKGDKPNESEVRKARRALDRLVNQGKAKAPERGGSGGAGGSQGTRYYAVELRRVGDVA